MCYTVLVCSIDMQTSAHLTRHYTVLVHLLRPCVLSESHRRLSKTSGKINTIAIVGTNSVFLAAQSLYNFPSSSPVYGGGVGMLPGHVEGY